MEAAEVAGRARPWGFLLQSVDEPAGLDGDAGGCACRPGDRLLSPVVCSHRGVLSALRLAVRSMIQAHIPLWFE